jgi:hypothetical protein
MTDRRRFLRAGAAGLLGLSAPLEAAPAGETLPNGIRLPARWPPRPAGLPREPVTPPYLKSPPAVIPVDLGRQLFVDDFLIEKSTLRRTHHRAEHHPGGPVVRPDREWEKGGAEGSAAMVFSDGVWYDPAEKLFKMWYMGGLLRGTCYATSEDGLRWRKPALGVRKGTNVVQPDPRDSNTVWLDLEEKEPKRRYKMFRSWRVKKGWGLSAHFSADGVHWGDVAFKTGPCGDRTTVFYNPFRKVWVYSLRADWGGARARRYWEVRDLLRGPRWTRADEPPLWVGADRLDPERADLKTRCQLYNLDCVAYESVLRGLFTIWRGQPRDRQKPNEVLLGYSRDGWHWHRPDRRAFCGVSEKFGAWNYSNVQSAGGGCLVVGDRLYFYVSGRAGVRGKTSAGVCSTALATLRRDGFASMDAGPGGGTLTTRPVRFGGGHLFVNVRCAGELRVEVLDGKGNPLAPFTKANCLPVTGDRTRQGVRWKGAKDLSAVAGKPVKLRFWLTRGELFSFWVSKDARGASGGYVAAGGPGFTGPRDT